MYVHDAQVRVFIETIVDSWVVWKNGCSVWTFALCNVLYEAVDTIPDRIDGVLSKRVRTIS